MLMFSGWVYVNRCLENAQYPQEYPDRTVVEITKIPIRAILFRT